MNAIEHAKFAYKIAKERSNHHDVYLYNKSNENLNEIFNHFDVSNKDVLTVLASSDQLFSCYAKGAKSVDTFDKVYITLYYYYLRKWLILYKNQVHTPYDYFTETNYSLYAFISNIEPHNEKEKEAKSFWLNYLKLNNHKLDDYLFYISKRKEKSPFEDEIDYLKSKLKNDINFYNLDISNEINVNKKYDVIILSNILEFQSNDKCLTRIRNNLERLLNYNGSVLCSYKLDDSTSCYHKREIEILTQNKLKFMGEITYYDKIKKREKDLCYTYKKTRF